MSKVVHGFQVFSKWENYQEHGWRSYGHGTCGEWFNGAYDHPDIEKRGKIRFNDKLRDFFVNTKRTFVTLKSLTGVDYEITNDIRLINESYSGNYWFNDYVKIMEVIIKKQFLDINNIDEYEKKIKDINDKIKNVETDEKKIVNDYIQENYDFIDEIATEYKKFYLHDFSNNNIADYYNKKKIIVNFLK